MITIKPENPTSDDHVVLEFTGPGCGVTGTSKTIIGSQFIFTVHNDNPCVLVPGYQFSWSIGRLEAGEYQVIHEHTTFVETASQAFMVSQGQLPAPIPSSIPSLGIPATILLAIVLAWIANKSLKRTRKRAA